MVPAAEGTAWFMSLRSLAQVQIYLPERTGALRAPVTLSPQAPEKLVVFATNVSLDESLASAWPRLVTR